MKIKELFEAEDNAIRYLTGYRFLIENPDWSHDALKKELEKEDLFFKFKLDVMNANTVRIDFADIPHITKETQQELNEKILKVLFHFDDGNFTNIKNFYDMVFINALPKNTIDAKNITFNLQAFWWKNINLSGLEKVLKCDTLSISDSENINGGLLSLLKMKKTKVKLNTSKKTTDWLPILQHHLDTDKDILACQEDLIDAGFKTLATL